jgi:hypothetical protein
VAGEAEDLTAWHAPGPTLTEPPGDT